MEVGSSNPSDNQSSGCEADSASADSAFVNEDDDVVINTFYPNLRPNEKREMLMADRLSRRLLAAKGDSLEEDQILEETLKLVSPVASPLKESFSRSSLRSTGRFRNMFDSALEEQERAKSRVQWMGVLVIFLAAGVVALVGYGLLVLEASPPLQPVGPYRLIERQEGESLLGSYTFYVGKDSVGSNGFNYYVDEDTAEDLGIVNITMEEDEMDLLHVTKENNGLDLLKDVYYNKTDGRRLQSAHNTSAENLSRKSSRQNRTSLEKRPFVYIGSSATQAGPRNSIRLEGNRRFDRGLFIMDVRRMPAGCGVWPAFWLVDELNWPVNGEIDIVEGVNYQTEAKTALHSTRGCKMDDIPLGTMSGTWDTAQGIPDRDTGIPDMTLRYAQNCFVYEPHQWLNQGCVAIDQDGDSIGVPLNEKGGGVYVLEWDPINRHIRSWVFSPHTSVPENLILAIRTAEKDVADRVMPDPEEWPTPYAYFAIGRGTNCNARCFKHMHLVINTAFCGSVAGNRYHIDCTAEQTTKFPTCRDYVKSNPQEIQDSHWKIRGIYIYEREWERTWIT